jgi:hypothetical protein
MTRRRKGASYAAPTLSPRGLKWSGPGLVGSSGVSPLQRGKKKPGNRSVSSGRSLRVTVKSTQVGLAAAKAAVTVRIAAGGPAHCDAGNKDDQDRWRSNDLSRDPRLRNVTAWHYGSTSMSRAVAYQQPQCTLPLALPFFCPSLFHTISLSREMMLFIGT